MRQVPSLPTWSCTGRGTPTTRRRPKRCLESSTSWRPSRLPPTSMGRHRTDMPSRRDPRSGHQGTRVARQDARAPQRGRSSRSARCRDPGQGCLAEKWMSRPIRRVLFRTAVTSGSATAIHLGRPLLTGSSALPAHSTGPVSNVRCLGLLRVGFTEPRQSPGVLVVSYTTVSPLPGTEVPGGLFSVALSRGSPRVAVGHHPALRSPDVPRRALRPDATAWPTHPRPF